MRTDKQTRQDIVTQIHIRQGGADKGLAIARRRKNKHAAAALELQHIRVGHGQRQLLGGRSFGAPELQGGQSAAVLGGVGIRRVGLQAGTDHPTGLAMLHRALADERQAGAQNEISAGLAPGKMELVRAKPHVGARTGDGVGLSRRFIRGIAGQGWRADIAMILKDANGIG